MFIVEPIHVMNMGNILIHMTWHNNQSYIIHWNNNIKLIFRNHIGRVMVCVLASSGVDRGFESRWDQTKNNNIWFVVYSISTEHAALSSKRKEWLTQNQENVYEWSEMSYSGPLCQCASTKQLNYGCWCREHHHHHLIVM